MRVKTKTTMTTTTTTTTTATAFTVSNRYGTRWGPFWFYAAAVAAAALVVALPGGLLAVSSEGGRTPRNHTMPHLENRNNTNGARECRPILNFAFPLRLEAPTSGTYDIKTESSESSIPALKLSPLPDHFSINYADLDLPISQLNPIGADSEVMAYQQAFKWLSSFEEQFYGEDKLEENVIRFHSNRLHVSGLNITMLNVHLYESSEPHFAIGFNVANTTLAGQFLFEGQLPLLSSEHTKMLGNYRIYVDNLLVMVTTNLTKVRRPPTEWLKETYGEEEAQSFHLYDLVTSDLKVDVSQMGYVSIKILDAKDMTRPNTNYVLNLLQKFLQKTVKRTYDKFEHNIRATLELEARRFIDCELTRFGALFTEGPIGLVKGLFPRSQEPIISTQPPAHTSYLRDLAKIVSLEITNTGLNLVPLPDFDYQRSQFGVKADISFHNGTLEGLANFRLNGETRIKLLEDHLIVNASVGWSDLKPRYEWTLYLGGKHGSPASGGERRSTSEASATANTISGDMITASANASSTTTSTTDATDTKQSRPKPQKPTTSGHVAFSIKAIDFEAVISKSVKSQSRLVVEDLKIRRLDQPKIDISGLPGLNRLTRSAVNFFIGRLNARLVSSIQPLLKQELERTLNRLLSWPRLN